MDDSAARMPWLCAADARVEDLAAAVARRTDPADCPLAAEIVQDVPVYDCAALRARLAEPGHARALQAEWLRAFAEGPGIVALRGAFDAGVVDRVGAHFREMIEDEREQGTSHDHFGGAAGTN